MGPRQQWRALEDSRHFRDTEETAELQWEDKKRDKGNTKSFSVTWILTVYDNDIWNIYWFFFPKHITFSQTPEAPSESQIKGHSHCYKQGIFNKAFSEEGTIIVYHQFWLPCKNHGTLTKLSFVT